MKLTRIMFAAAMTAVVAGAAHAQQPLGIGTSAQGAATYSIGSAIARVASEKGNQQVLVQPHGGTGAVVPLVNTGRLDLGLANILEVTNAVKGRGPFKDRPHENLRVVGVMYPFRVGFFVRDDSDIRTVADLKGQRIGSEYTSQRIIGILVNAMLANAGLSMDDMEAVPVENIVRQADDFAAGKLDVGFFALGAGKVNQVDAAVGGIRYISIDTSDAAVARMKEIVPPSYAQETPVTTGFTGIDSDVSLMAYDYLLYAGAHVPDDDVFELARIIAENKDALASSFRPFVGLDPARMGTDIGLDYHPGAEKYYRGAGIWPGRN